MNIVFILFLFLSEFGISASEQPAVPEMITITLKNEKLKQELSFNASREVLDYFTTYKNMIEDTHRGNPTLTIPIHSYKRVAVYCVCDQFRIAGKECSKIAVFGDDYDMHEYMRMAEYGDVADNLLSLFVQRGADSVVRYLKPHIVNIKKDKSFGDEFVKRIFPMALKASTDHQVKKFWRGYFYEKMYENKEFKNLEEEVSKKISSDIEDACVRVKDLSGLKNWEESFERMAFCAAVVNEPSLHQAYNYKEGGVFFGDDSKPISFIKKYFAKDDVSLEYLHLPLLRLIMLHDHECHGGSDWASGDGGWHPTTTTFDFSAYPLCMTSADWKTVAKYPATYKRGSIVWKFNLNDEVESIPWNTLHEIKASMDQYVGVKPTYYGNVELISRKVLLLSGMNEVLLIKPASYTQKLYSIAKYTIWLGGFLVLNSFFAMRDMQKMVMYQNKIDQLVNAAASDVISTAHALLQAGQTLLPGVTFKIPTCATLPSVPQIKAPTLPIIQEALQMIQSINNLSVPRTSILTVIPLMIAGCILLSLGYNMGAKCAKNKVVATYNGTLLRHYSPFRLDFFSDETHGCWVTVKKPDEA